MNKTSTNTNLARRVVLKAAGLAGVAAVGTAGYANAQPRNRIPGAFRPGPAIGPAVPPAPSRGNTPPPTPALATIGVTESVPHLALSFTGHQQASISNQARTVEQTFSNVPTNVVIGNTGSATLPAGTRIELRTTALDAAGLVVSNQPGAPVTMFGAVNNVRQLLTIQQTASGTVLHLSQPLQPGQQLTVHMRLHLAGHVRAGQLPGVRMTARVILNADPTGYVEFQSPETVLRKV